MTDYDRKQIENLYKKYWQYMIEKDINSMDAIMSDDYELQHMTGKRQSKHA